MLFEDIRINNFLLDIFKSFRIPSTVFSIFRFYDQIIIQGNLHLMFIFKNLFFSRNVFFFIRKHYSYYFNHRIFNKMLYLFLRKLIRIVIGFFFSKIEIGITKTENNQNYPEYSFIYYYNLLNINYINTKNNYIFYYLNNKKYINFNILKRKYIFLNNYNKIYFVYKNIFFNLFLLKNIFYYNYFINNYLFKKKTYNNSIKNILILLLNTNNLNVNKIHKLILNFKYVRYKTMLKNIYF